MKWSEYKILSEKTLSQEFHTGKQVQNLLHGVMGLLTELDELLEYSDDVNRNEEIGDIFWFLSLIDRELEINFEISKYDEQFIQLDDSVLVNMSLKKSLKLLDMVRKKIYYNRSINIETFKSLSCEIFDLISKLCHINEIKMEEVWDKNIKKLKSIYGEKFSEKNAVDRDLEKVRLILEE